MEIKLEDIIIRKLSEKDSGRAEDFLEFLNALVEEDAKILANEKMSLEEEKKWLEEKIKDRMSDKEIFLVAEHDGKIVADTHIKLGKWRQNHIGTFGIAIDKNYRGMGLGTKLMAEIIKLAQKELKPCPKIIRLEVLENNKPAQALYKKMGFKKVAKLPKQIQYKGKLVSEFVMLLELK
jgi:ribosomal protein S18 acetylase RimI-like enzyme